MTRSRRNCPGKCNRTIPPTLFACKTCQSLLPHHVRHSIVASAGKPMTPSKRAAWVLGTEWLERLVRV
ncbi:MAG: hypothetical protein WBF79_15105 [Rhodococcus sp. (in: high G+C Gram-positive bacteria)]